MADMRTVALVCLLAACGPSTKGGGEVTLIGGRPAKPGEEVPVGGEPMRGVVVEAKDPGVAPPHAMVAGRRRGVPHFAQIMAVVADQDGNVAVTRDALGSVRIWPALDGTVEPQVVPVKSAEAMAIATRADGSLAAMIDGTGLATLVRFDKEGMVRATGTLSPDIPLSGVVVMPGGERVIAVRSDQRISLLDASGTELSRLSVRGGRVMSMHVAGDRLVAVVRKMADEVATYELRRVTLDKDVIAWSGDGKKLAEPIALLPHVAAALSPDGSLFAYMSGDPNASVLKIVRTDSGAAIRLDGDVTTTFPATTMVGFVDDNAVEMAATNALAWRIEIAGGNGSAISKAISSGTATPAFALHKRIVGYQAHLAIHADNGDVAYLGHRELSPSTGALASDGTSAAWITSSGALVIQRFDGSEDIRIKGPSDWFGTVAIVDDGHVLAGRSNGQLSLYDSRSGEEIASMVAAASTPWFMYEPKTKLIGVLRDAGVVWAIPLDTAAADPFGGPIAVGDGAQSFTLLDPDKAKGAALMTFDAQLTARRYTWKELEDGVSIAEMKKHKTTLSTSAWYFDRAGRYYVGTGLAVEVRDGTDLVSTISMPNGAGGIWPSPGGERVMIMDGSGMGPLRAFKTDGKELWSSSSMRNIFQASWSGDGKRVVVFGSGGGAVLDGSTGKALIGASGWAFGLSTEVPTAFPPGVEPMIDFE